MADSTTEQRDSEPGYGKVKEFIAAKKIDFALYVTRVCSIFFIIGYFIPLFWNSYTLYYKALMSNAATNALRLHQRLPQVSFSKEFFQKLIIEDSFHYLFYSIIFLYIAPVTLALQPIFIFSLILSATYSLSLLDCLGQNAWWGARLIISVLEFQTPNLFRLVSFTEIILMPFTIFLLFLGRASLLTPFFYYQFLSLRYSSRRNRYTRDVFHDLRLYLESTASKPSVPEFVRNFLLFVISAMWEFHLWDVKRRFRYGDVDSDEPETALARDSGDA